VADVSDEPGKEWVGTPLDAVRIDPRAIVEITV
jgi:DNA-binding CsgD family transcriptional regulator